MSDIKDAEKAANVPLSKQVNFSEFFQQNSKKDEKELLPAFTKFLSNHIAKNRLKGTELTDLVCAICQDNIENFLDICRLKCTCQLWYHHSCLLQAYKDSKQRGKCLQCRKNISIILAWDTVLRKYGLSSSDWKDTYHQLYTEFLQKRDYKNQIRLTKLFFEDIKIFRDKLPNYILLPILSFRDYLVYDHTEHVKQLYAGLSDNLTLVPIIGNKNVEVNKILAMPAVFGDGDYIIVDRRRFDQRFQEFSYDLFDDSFDWHNICLAGGSLYRLLVESFSADNIIPDTSDLDLFIHGHKQEDRTRALNRTINYFKNRYGADVFYVVHAKRGLVDIYIRGIARHVQIICNTSSSIVETLELFDLEHLQLCYFNHKLYATPAAIEAIKTQVSRRCRPGTKLKATRVAKALQFHLSLILNLDQNNERNDKQLAEEHKNINNIIYQLKNINIKSGKKDGTDWEFSNFKILTPNNAKPYLDTQEKNGKHIPKDLVDLKKINTCYHPKFEESDEEVVSNLRKNIHNESDLYFTKDVNLVTDRIKFVERKADQEFYYGGTSAENLIDTLLIDNTDSDNEVSEEEVEEEVLEEEEPLGIDFNIPLNVFNINIKKDDEEDLPELEDIN